MHINRGAELYPRGVGIIVLFTQLLQTLWRVRVPSSLYIHALKCDTESSPRRSVTGCWTSRWSLRPEISMTVHPTSEHPQRQHKIDIKDGNKRPRRIFGSKVHYSSHSKFAFLFPSISSSFLPTDLPTHCPRLLRDIPP